MLINARLHFRLYRITFNCTSYFRGLTNTFTFNLTRFRNQFIRFRNFNNMRCLCMNLYSAFFSTILTLYCTGFNGTIIRLLLFSNIRTFPTIMRNPINVSTMTTIVKDLTLTTNSIITISSNIYLTLQTVRSALTRANQGTKRRDNSNNLCVCLNAFHIRTILTSNSILLRNVISTHLRIPLNKRTIN